MNAITITDEIYKGYTPDTGFEFLLQNGFGLVILIALVFLIYHNVKNFYNNTKKFLKCDNKYYNYYMFALCKNTTCYFMILSLITLIFQIVNIDIEFVKQNFIIDFSLANDSGDFHIDILNSAIIITLLYTLTILFDLLSIKSKPNRTSTSTSTSKTNKTNKTKETVQEKDK